MAVKEEHNTILQELVQKAVKYFFNYVQKNKIKCMLLTGSLAHGEGNVIIKDDSIITSDFDFAVFVSLPYFIANRSLFLKASEEITQILRRKKLFTYVNFVPSIRFLSRFTPGIYQYEFAAGSKGGLGQETSNKN